MPHPELVERADRLEIRSPVHVGMRVLFAVLGLFPLLAPYELLIRVDWGHYLNPFFFLSAFISAGATAVSALFFFTAVAGLSSRMVFDRRAATFHYSSQAPIVRRSRRSHPLSDIRCIEAGIRDWSDSAPTYHLGVSMRDGTVFESGSSWSRNEIESIRSGVDRFLAAIGE